MNNNKHNEFVESLRSIMRKDEQKQTKELVRNTEEYGENNQILQELLAAKFDELFGLVDED